VACHELKHKSIQDRAKLLHKMFQSKGCIAMIGAGTQRVCVGMPQL
jgi:hypothetical protein